MNLPEFGQQLRTFRKQRGWERKDLADELERIALAGPADDRRDVDATLIGKWERAYQKRRPTRAYVIHLIELFRQHLDLSQAFAWASKAGYQLRETDLTTIFPTLSLHPPPVPNPSVTLHRLDPLPPHRLFGIEAALDKLLHALNHQDDPWLLAIDGIGGIGKTALANQLVRKILPTQRFYDVVWISARKEEFVPLHGIRAINRPVIEAAAFIDKVLEQLDPDLPLARSLQEKTIILTHWLKTNPCLVVIDNLETVTDYEVLMPTLYRLARPTKFLLTSRQQVAEEIYRHHLGELSQTVTLEFLRYMGPQYDLPALAQAPDNQLNGIYQVVGGNPLALKLVVGQMSVLSLPQVLDNLKQAQGKPIEELYHYIYRKAWDLLDAAAQRTFLMMPLAQNGTQEQLATLTQLSAAKLTQALQDLAQLSLIQVKGNLEERRYTLHRLTETFLLTKAIQWKELV